MGCVCGHGHGQGPDRGERKVYDSVISINSVLDILTENQYNTIFYSLA